jgi:hypothetical protein
MERVAVYLRVPGLASLVTGYLSRRLEASEFWSNIPRDDQVSRKEFLDLLPWQVDRWDGYGYCERLQFNGTIILENSWADAVEFAVEGCGVCWQGDQLAIAVSNAHAGTVCVRVVPVGFDLRSRYQICVCFECCTCLIEMSAHQDHAWSSIIADDFRRVGWSPIPHTR